MVWISFQFTLSSQLTPMSFPLIYFYKIFFILSVSHKFTDISKKNFFSKNPIFHDQKFVNFWKKFWFLTKKIIFWKKVCFLFKKNNLYFCFCFEKKHWFFSYRLQRFLKNFFYDFPAIIGRIIWGRKNCHNLMKITPQKG